MYRMQRWVDFGLQLDGGSPGGLQCWRNTLLPYAWGGRGIRSCELQGS